MIRSCLFYLLLAMTNFAVASQELLPGHVDLKTTQQSFSYEYYYALKDGRIWIKPNERTVGVKGEWALFEGTGVPFGENITSFGSDDRVVEIGTEGTMVIALSNHGRFYKWQPTYQEHTVWEEDLGSPVPGTLSLPKSRTWGFSFSVARAPWKRLTPMHDIVQYYEDADGNRIEYGLTATIFTLDADGQKIRYWDTGLPPSFHKAFATPDRGRFVAENMSVSASTVLVIDRTGRMFTKMHDYEINSACPGLRFTYKREKRRSDPEGTPLLEAVRTLPMPDWREQEAIQLQGRAVVTKNISIHLTGEGNAARELRVQGRDAAGNEGYYYKPIFDSEWKFRITGESLRESDIIENYLGTPVYGKQLDKTYVGKIDQIDDEDTNVELVDFYYFNSPAKLRVTVWDEQFDMILHTADAWSLTTQQQSEPLRVGDVNGEPKVLYGTLEIPTEVLNSKNPLVQMVLEQHFKRFNLVTFAFRVLADDDKVILNSQRIQRESVGYFDYEYRKPLSMTLTQKGDRKSLENWDGHGGDEDEGAAVAMNDGRDSKVTWGFTFLANHPELIVDEFSSLTQKDIPFIDGKLDRNRKMLDTIKTLNRREKMDHLKKGLINGAGSIIFYPIIGIVNLVGMPSYYPVMGGITLAGTQTFSSYADMNLKIAFHYSEDYKQAESILLKRIEQLKKERKRLRNSR